ncbi:MerR family transcriptional regulator [Geobacter sp. FeAm09]|uniref:MerR family transcriptional regulator n=1 Tax=Geobacter sp. FeAm09 TaxID=2597769 RepID=UPI0011F02BFA|nr:MerR family transcriptional regulator [Geobacter sp. FeAm09]QEM68679.1 MerR family transcriptional regulator [Geobacter sp. FeAm09]
MGATFPDKLYYKIGEVAQMAGVRTSVLRFWETEFEFLKPEKSTTGQRLYSKREVDIILQVRRLLYDEKFTIEGVKRRITPKGRIIAGDGQPPAAPTEKYLLLLRDIRDELLLLRNQM